MKDKAIEILKNYENKTNVFYLHTIDIADVINMMLEFGHYVAEEQKKQCLKESLIEMHNQYGIYTMKQTHGKQEDLIQVDEKSILNSKNVCEQ